jgi:hypothetical protein
MVMRYAHLSPAYLSSEVGLLDAPTQTPPCPEETHSGKRARKWQCAGRERVPQIMPREVFDLAYETHS